MRERDVRKTIAAICDKLDRVARRGGPAALVPLVVGLQAIDWGCASVYGETGECYGYPSLGIALGMHLHGATVTVAGPCQAPKCNTPESTQCGYCYTWFDGELGDSCEITLHLLDGTTCTVERVFDRRGACDVPEADPIDFDCETDSLCPTGGPFDGGT